RFLGRTERRVVSAILVTAMIPLVGSLLAGRTIIANISATAFQPEFGEHLDQTLLVYADLVKTIKESMRFQADAMAAAPGLAAAVWGAALRARRGAVGHELGAQFAAPRGLGSRSVESEEGKALARRERAEPVDMTRERTLTIRKPLAARPAADDEP